MSDEDLLFKEKLILMNNNINAQITALYSQIENLKNNKTLSLLDDFLIKVWERNISILTKQEIK